MVELASSFRILGLDPGSRRFGNGVVECNERRVTYVECGVLEPPAGASLEIRLGEIAVGLDEVLDELRPTVVAVEDVFSGTNARSALLLGQARGVALALSGRAGLKVHAYPPATVKKRVTGSGRATKEQVLAMVQTLCRLRRAPKLDASDALAVAICHAFSRRISSLGMER